MTPLDDPREDEISLMIGRRGACERQNEGMRHRAIVLTVIAVLVVGGGAGAALTAAFGTSDTGGQVQDVAPIVLPSPGSGAEVTSPATSDPATPGASSTPGPSSTPPPTATPATPEPVEPAEPHDVGDDHGGGSNSGSGDDSSSDD